MRWIKAVAALAVLALLVAGVPVMLATAIGNPWPDAGVSLDQPLTDEAIIGLLAALAWVLWAQLAVCIVVEGVAAVRNDNADSRVPISFEFQQHLARVLVTAVVLAIGSGTINSLSAGTATAATTVPETAAAATTQTPAPEATATPTVEQVRETAATITVQHGDTLWRLAEQHLGDGVKFADIAELNEGRTMSDGKVFRSSESLMPGWELIMPAVETGLGVSKESASQVEVQPGDTLSTIAEQQYGDGAEWSKIWQANQGEQFEDGRTLTDPDLIQPGWELALPAAEGTASTPAPAAEPAPAATAPESAPAAAAPDPAPEPAAPPEPAPAPAQVATAVPEPTRAGAATGAEMADPAASAAPAGSSSSTGARPDAVAGTADGDLPSWVMPGLAGGGALLAGSLLLALRARRAAQHRVRRPGRSIAATIPELTALEKSITVAGSETAVSVEGVETLLVRLATSLTARSIHLPPLAAVEVTSSAIAVHLRTPSVPPGDPWVVSEDGLLWVVDARLDLDLVGPHEPDSPAPWPLLVTVGQDDSGVCWMLNLEDLDVVVTGDQTAGADFARFVAAEVSCNPWSKHIAVDVVGIAQEVAAMNPERVTVHAGAAGAAAVAVAEAVGNIDRLATDDIDTTTARARQADADPWPARILIVDRSGDVPELEQLMGLVRDHYGRTATAVLLPGAPLGSGFEIHIDERCRLTIPSVNLTVRAVGLTAAEAHGCAALLAQADVLTDETAPDLAGNDAWRPMVNAMGSLRDQYTVSRSGPTAERATSMLASADEEYTRVAATTPADLQAIAPRVTQTIRDKAAAADPNLDEDLQAWEATSCARPRLALLGPVGARASGIALERRKPFYTELFAYLATRPYGATTDEVAAAFNLNAARVRTDVNKLRDWLGSDPATGRKFVPAAREAPSAQQRGIGVYEVVDALVDIDLFRRLRLRGETRGPAGVEDLERALQLVRGRPFGKLRPGGWGWMLEVDRTDQHMVCAIADVAHVVVTHNLQTGDRERAHTAASIAVEAAADEEISRLDLAAVLAAQGHVHEADRIIREDVCNRDDAGEAPTELSVRTGKIIEVRGWSQHAAI